jgi:hypothetical protein
VKKAILVGLSVFVALLAAMVLYWSGYHGASGSRRTVYRVNIFTGEVTVERTQVVGQGAAPVPEREAPPHAVAKHSLSEREAKRIIEDHFGRADVIPLGSYAVGAEAWEKRPTNLQLGYLAPDHLMWLKTWAKVGAISLSSTKTLDKGKEFNSKEFMNYTQGEVAEYVFIVPTEKGLRIGEKKVNVVEFLSIPNTTKYEVTKVEKMDDKKYGTAEYKVVYCSYEATWSPIHLELLKAQGLQPENKRKAVVLLTRDPLKQSWSVAISDHADSDKKFTTHKVEIILSRVQR